MEKLAGKGFETSPKLPKNIALKLEGVWLNVGLFRISSLFQQAKG